MTNDTSTLNGALQELGETMASNLQAKGVTASASDGLTTLAGKILTIPSGGSCYHIEFSEDSYTAVGGTATLEIMLQENYAPKSGATVTVTGSDSSLYTGITNSNGIAEVIVSNVSGTVTFTCTYSNVSDTCTVTGITYLFYDSGVTGTKNTDFTNTNSSKASVTTTSECTTFAGTSGSDDKHYVPNLNLSGYSSWTFIWTYMGGQAYACQTSLLNSSRSNLSSTTRWHNSGSSTPTKSWTTPTTGVTISHLIEVGDTMKLVKNGTTYSFYCNNELISSYTTNSTVYYVGFTTVSSNRPFKYKDLYIFEGVQ